MKNLMNAGATSVVTTDKIIREDIRLWLRIPKVKAAKATERVVES